MSADLNVWTGVGRLTRDAETPQGNGPARFAIACSRRIKRGEEWTDEASFFDVEYWHRSLLPYMTKGKQVAIRGELKQDRWDDRETGKPRSKIVIVAQDVQLLSGGGTREEGRGEAQAGTDGRGDQYDVARAAVAPPAARQAKLPLKLGTKTEMVASPSGDAFDDEIPF